MIYAYTQREKERGALALMYAYRERGNTERALALMYAYTHRERGALALLMYRTVCVNNRGRRQGAWAMATA